LFVTMELSKTLFYLERILSKLEDMMRLKSIKSASKLFDKKVFNKNI